MNLSNASQIRFNGSDIKLIKFDGFVIYEIKSETPGGFYIEYTVDALSTKALNGGYSSIKYGLPRVYSGESTYSFYDYEKIEITLFDGSTTTDVTTTCNNIAKVKLWYPETTVATKFYSALNVRPLLVSVKYCNTSNFTDMSYMFYYCENLTSVNASNWDTSSVTYMNSMFYFCNSLTSLDVSNWDTSSVIDMSLMFADCDSLTSIGDISNWDTSSVIDMNYMFSFCNSLTSIGDISNWDTSSVTNMNGMFYYCNSLTSIGDISNWDTSSVTNMAEMFYCCYTLESLDLSNWDTSSVTYMNSMFYFCNSLTSLDVSNWDVSNVTNMDSMFDSCYLLTSLDLSNWDVSNVTNMDWIFYDCSSLVTLNAPKNISAYISLNECVNLSHDSLMSVINNLATVTTTQTLTLGSTNLAKLTDGEIAIATNKGWTVK